MIGGKILVTNVFPKRSFHQYFIPRSVSHFFVGYGFESNELDTRASEVAFQSVSFLFSHII